MLLLGKLTELVMVMLVMGFADLVTLLLPG